MSLFRKLVKALFYTYIEPRLLLIFKELNKVRLYLSSVFSKF